MITEAMVMKGLAIVGAGTIGTKVIAPIATKSGLFIGRCAGSLVNRMTKKGNKTKSEKVETDQAKEQAIIDLLAECEKQMAEDGIKEPELKVVEETKPEPKYDQQMREWIQHCKDQYGGFANIVLD